MKIRSPYRRGFKGGWIDEIEIRVGKMSPALKKHLNLLTNDSLEELLLLLTAGEVDTLLETKPSTTRDRTHGTEED